MPTIQTYSATYVGITCQQIELAAPYAPSRRICTDPPPDISHPRNEGAADSSQFRIEPFRQVFASRLRTLTSMEQYLFERHSSAQAKLQRKTVSHMTQTRLTPTRFPLLRPDRRYCHISTTIAMITPACSNVSIGRGMTSRVKKLTSFSTTRYTPARTHLQYILAQSKHNTTATSFDRECTAGANQLVEIPGSNLP